MKRYIILILLCIAQIDVISQQIITINTDSVNSQSYAPRRLIEQTGNSIIVTYNFDNALLIEDELFPGSYIWNYNGFGLTEESGKPSLPYRTDAFSVNGHATIEIIDTSYVDFAIKLAPARIPLNDSEYSVHSLDNTDTIIQYSGFFPDKILLQEDKQYYRDNGIIRVNITPLQYNMENQIIRAYKKIQYKITIEQIDFDFTNQNITDLKDCFISNNTINQPINPLMAKPSNIVINKDYLILSDPKFEDVCNTFANWKRTLGYRTHVILKDDWTSTSVKSAIQELYETNGVKLYYLLIIGDENVVPPIYKSNSQYNYITDLPYGCMNGNEDITPDIYRGRIPVSTIEDANVVINKIINYEKTPVSDSTFYKTGINCAYFQDNNLDGFADRRFAQTSEDVRNYLSNHNKIINRIYYTQSTVMPKNWNKGSYSKGEPIPIELQKPNFSWSGNKTDIINNLNQGAFYILHRDHGATSGWGDPQFYTDDLLLLNNGNKLPIVFSMNCLSGNYSSHSCFAEKFITKTNGGCVGIFAATQISYSGYNDALMIGMIDAIWPEPGLIVKFPYYNNEISTISEPIYELGQILEQGLQRMEDTYGSSTYHNYTREIFHCFGDPSMQIYTDTPQCIENPQIFKNKNTIYVNIPDGDARIAFYTPSKGKVDTYWGNNVKYLTTDNNVIICISRHNYIPYIAMSEDLVYIQNEIVNNDRVYEAHRIEIGKKVSSEIESGDVIFNSGNIDITSNKTIFAPGTYIRKGATLTVTPKN